MPTHGLASGTCVLGSLHRLSFNPPCVVRPTVYATVMTKSLSVSRLLCSLWHTQISSGEVSRFPSLEALTLSVSIHWVKEGMCGLLLCSALTVKTWTLAWRGKALKQPAPALWTFTSLRSSSNLKQFPPFLPFLIKVIPAKKKKETCQVCRIFLCAWLQSMSPFRGPGRRADQGKWWPQRALWAALSLSPMLT